MSKSPLTISVPEAAERVGIGRDTAYDEARAYIEDGTGKIPAIRMGRLLRVPVRLLERMLDGDDNARPKSKSAT